MEERQDGWKNQAEKERNEQAEAEPASKSLPPLIRSRVPQNAPPVDPPRAEP
jgi:hypothetical protein